MEAKHEGTVSSVDISQDGIQIICGTNNGSIGLLDISSQNYRTLLRSHIDSIVSVDYHKTKNEVISVSKDKTIRVWDMSI